MHLRTLFATSLLCTIAHPIRGTAPQKAALKAFKGFVKKSNKFDVTAYDVIADDAAMSHLMDGQHRLETNGAQFKALAMDNMVAAEALGDVDVFSELSAADIDGGVRITGTLFVLEMQYRHRLLCRFCGRSTVHGPSRPCTRQAPNSPSVRPVMQPRRSSASMEQLGGKLPMAVDEETNWLDLN